MPGTDGTASQDDEHPWCVHIHVHGRVQGVGYRAFAVTAARRRGCCGFVRNASQRTTVAIVAEGTRQSLELLLTDLQRGPARTRVARLDAVWDVATNAFEGFVVQ